MKKFLGILTAAMVAVISVFSLSGNYKNSAEPQYFYNSSIKNAIVQNSEENSFSIILDNNISNYSESNVFYTLGNILANTNVNIHTTTNEEITIYNSSSEQQLLFNSTLDEYSNTYENIFIIEDMSRIIQYKTDITLPDMTFKANQWYAMDLYNSEQLTVYPINKIELQITLNDTLENTNNKLTPYIGNLTEIPTEPDTPEQTTTPLTQIGSIITDTIGWFTNIFTGLSAAFYIDGELTTWGTVLFIGVAITIIAMVLKWLISLIKGV